jgi:cytoskeletal protein CcmA (bactofilin family)
MENHEQKKVPDLNLSGVGTASGGVYRNVKIEGVGRVNGDVECEQLDMSGVANISGNVKAKKMKINGKSSIHGDITAEELHIEGSVKMEGNCEAESFFAAGSFQLAGLLNAGKIEIQLYGPSRIREIGGETIRIDRERGFGLFARFKKLTVEIIEGDEVYLENTKADVVRGGKVSIGPGCEIDLVEYRVDFEQAKDAKVATHKQM